VAQYLKFDPVTDEDRTAMNLHNRDSIHTTIPISATRPVITPDNRAIFYSMNGLLPQLCHWHGKTGRLRHPCHDQTHDAAPPLHIILPLGIRAQARMPKSPWSEVQHIVIA